MSKSSKTFQAVRDTRTGQFVPQAEASKRPATTVKESVPKHGFGHTKPKPPKK